MTTPYSYAELLALKHTYGSRRAAAKAVAVGESTFRVWESRLKKTAGAVPIPDYAFRPGAATLPPTHIEGDGIPTESREKPGITQRFIVTSAQNNVRVHSQFLANLQALAKHLKAEILVGCTLYDRANYRGLLGKGDGPLPQREGIWWDKAIQPYIQNQRVVLHRRLLFCGELDILATARDPLSGMDSYCGRSSILVPHNRFAFRCVESRKHQMPKEMFTTGSVTLPRFIQRKAGQLAHFHHVVGALLVEVAQNGFWYVHHLNAETDGSFYWLVHRVAEGKVCPRRDSLPALILGDIHHERITETQSNDTLSLVRELQPDHVFVHDLIDFQSRNHHTRNDPFARVHHGLTRVEDELNRAAEWLTVLSQSFKGQTVVVKGNHDDALVRWLRETDWRDDPINARLYLTLALLLVERDPDSVDPLDYALRWLRPEVLTRSPRFLTLDESFEIAGIECGIHGHIGPSGTKGTPKGFARLGFKTFTGHTHTPSIHEGCYTVGVAGPLNMGYNKGPSRWMHVHGIIYPNGKRAFLFMKGGRKQA